ncbi:acyl-CoA N-acyltransferase [Echria macrotheca]|uniref:Acyl-CoA N-acyltransferase n=1 Tax=Echria macrotheca TaxID=438768 RepID=A0AAJ0B3W2_9PEZI|nr:acyl-CoA N-acyltransferase [Echria macrotheca]
MFLRLATASDLDAMTWVLIGASPLDPVYPYRFPDRHLYADEFAELCRQKCAEYLATSTVVVCEMPVDSDPRRTQVVAFSSWDAPHYKQSFKEPMSRLSNSPVLPITIGHRDRMNAFRAQCSAKKHELFDTRYRRGHMFLKILLCHPDYQRRGAGRALTIWGIEEARRLGLNTTVFASPMGFELYRQLGFREIGRFRVQLEGDEAYLDIPAMILRPGDTREREQRYAGGWGEGVRGCTTIACT